MKIESLDHLVLTVKSVERTSEFYQSVLGMKGIEFGGGRRALLFGRQKINLHEAGNEFEPKASHPTSGSTDLCFLTTTPLEEVIEELRSKNVKILEGPVPRSGATSRILSVYFRDPDENLVEVSNLQ